MMYPTQGLLDFPDNFLYLSDCYAADGSFEPFVGRNEASDVKVSCHNPLGQNIITCRHPYKNEFIEEVQGLDFDLKLTTPSNNIPSYIPILDLASSKIRAVPYSLPYVGITLKDILSRGGAKQVAGSYHEDSFINFRKNILSSDGFKSKKAILFLTGTDTLIESLWHKRDVCKLFEAIKSMGFWAVGSFNFSVIKGECAFAHALNLKRSLFAASLMQEHDIPVIPHLYAVNSFQVNRWIKWFQKNPSTTLFTINCQLQKKDCDIAQIVTTVKTILRQVPHLHVLLQGFHLTEMYQFGSLLQRIHLADKTPIKFAHMRREILINAGNSKLYDKRRSTKTKRELMVNNINSRYSFLMSLTSKVAEREIIKVYKTDKNE